MGSPYQSQSASGYNSSPPPDDGTTVAANKITWAKIKSALADSLKTLADAINTQLRTALNVSPSTTSIAYTTLVGDHLTTIEATGTFTISLGDAATMIAQSMGYTVTVYNKGTGTVTVGLITAANTLSGQANGTVPLPPGAAMTFTVAQSGVGYDILSATGLDPVVLTGAAGTNTATAAAPANLIALYNGLIVVWTPAVTNTAALTLNITPSGGSALTAKNVFAGGAACSGGEAKASVPMLLHYDGTQFNMLGLIGARGSFTATGTGFTANPTGTAVYSITNNVVTLFIPTLTGTSNATSFTITGLPAAITPTTNHSGFPTQFTNNSVVSTAAGFALIGSSGVITLSQDWTAAATWSNTGTKAITAVTFCYQLN